MEKDTKELPLTNHISFSTTLMVPSEAAFSVGQPRPTPSGGITFSGFCRLI